MKIDCFSQLTLPLPQKSKRIHFQLVPMNQSHDSFCWCQCFDCLKNTNWDTVLNKVIDDFEKNSSEFEEFCKIGNNKNSRTKCQPNEEDNKINHSFKKKKLKTGSRKNRNWNNINTYERDRLNKILKHMKGFKVEESVPYQWMIKRYGKIIQHKKYGKLYTYLKNILPHKLKPDRNTARNTKIRMRWFSQIWDYPEYRILIMDAFDIFMFKDILDIKNATKNDDSDEKNYIILE
ncbi:hypothetical protein TRFO_33613 [Tritrichomonas foetus]|uniref:Uncharacterized protein n=1 Tax=Tritrichomonas foetus TaxID=1144522 RepID=A0A1J4JQN4_9EUKA|nr:hypothetical protein TRFO_33613 [Tritrichomonas foetus]|eukprot:OHS99829.1 hypothetical protein TRFO_33613 [Tritrichomonas foetus]